MNRIFGLAALIAVHSLGTAQVWNEVGDAGDLLPTSQTTLGEDALTTIIGSVASDSDMYQINIVNSGAFSITVASGWDSTLYLFDNTGRGVVADGDGAGAFQPRINFNNVTPVTGLMHVIIGNGSVDEPWAVQGHMWDHENPANVGPNAIGANNPLDHWVDIGGFSGSYTVTLTGCEFAAVPEPSSIVAIGLGVVGFVVSRRRR